MIRRRTWWTWQQSGPTVVLGGATLLVTALVVGGRGPEPTFGSVAPADAAAVGAPATDDGATPSGLDPVPTTVLGPVVGTGALPVSSPWSFLSTTTDADTSAGAAVPRPSGGTSTAVVASAGPLPGTTIATTSAAPGPAPDDTTSSTVRPTATTDGPTAAGVVTTLPSAPATSSSSTVTPTTTTPTTTTPSSTTTPPSTTTTSSTTTTTTTSSTTTSPVDGVLLRTDFTGASDAASVGMIAMSPGPHGQSTDITVRNGVAMPAEVGVEALLRTPSLGSADQWIEATLHVGSSRVDNYTGIMVRVSDTGGRYAWHKFEVWAGSTTQFRLLTLVDNRIAEEHYFDYTIRPNSDYRLRLEARGTTLTGYVDGVRLFSVDVFLNTTATSTGLHFMTGGRLDDATLDDVETGVL